MLCLVRSVAEQAREPAFLHALCFSSYLGFSWRQTLTYKSNNPFSSQIPCGLCFITATESKSEQKLISESRLLLWQAWSCWFGEDCGRILMLWTRKSIEEILIANLSSSLGCSMEVCLEYWHDADNGGLGCKIAQGCLRLDQGCFYVKSNIRKRRHQFEKEVRRGIGEVGWKEGRWWTNLPPS